jgi:hypothetical protein
VVDFKEMERVRADSGALVRRLAGERDWERSRERSRERCERSERETEYAFSLFFSLLFCFIIQKKKWNGQPGHVPGHSARHNRPWMLPNA